MRASTSGSLRSVWTRRSPFRRLRAHRRGAGRHGGGRRGGPAGARVLSDPECFEEESQLERPAGVPPSTTPPRGVARPKGPPHSPAPAITRTSARWRRKQSILRTRQRRPDLYARTWSFLQGGSKASNGSWTMKPPNSNATFVYRFPLYFFRPPAATMTAQS